MSRMLRHNLQDSARHGREATIAQVIETIDRIAPETKAELAAEVGISEQYLSELLQELKRDSVVKKGYVVDETALYESVESVSQLADSPDQEANELRSRRRQNLLDLLERLDDVSRAQYESARLAFEDGSPEDKATQLEPLTNERHAAIFDELKSYMLATEWPGNRMASDLATMATNLEIVGDRACFIADIVDGRETSATGIVAERVIDIFEAGERINDQMHQIIFEADAERYDDLRTEEAQVHRDIDELFELVTAYDPDIYGYLVSVTRALERAIFYWVHTAELAVRLHTAQNPEHIAI
ncbi:PhoU family transcriptional regulator [Halorientalis pallida]|uniref:PhoU family transcriptional regulator n=1 Tax=Halorientalis pallida TaxID=2479928 RepID=A0A498KT50_9EURY|nr:PhoU family transcriptional regulator [Halorientalis pallida]RXK47836.1 PhoU family transcriptional regulator [Halorientalis pallida]